VATAIVFSDSCGSTSPSTMESGYYSPPESGMPLLCGRLAMKNK
jgi:hypothetical protein